MWLRGVPSQAFAYIAYRKISNYCFPAVPASAEEFAPNDPVPALKVFQRKGFILVGDKELKVHLDRLCQRCEFSTYHVPLSNIGLICWCDVCARPETVRVAARVAGDPRRFMQLPSVLEMEEEDLIPEGREQICSTSASQFSQTRRR